MEIASNDSCNKCAESNGNDFVLVEKPSLRDKASQPTGTKHSSAEVKVEEIENEEKSKNELKCCTKGPSSCTMGPCLSYVIDGNFKPENMAFSPQYIRHMHSWP